MSWFSLRWIQAGIIIIRIRIRVVVPISSLWQIDHLSFVRSGTTQSTLIIDTPSQDLVIACESNAVHSTNSDADDPDIFCREEWVETRTSNINNLLAICTLSRAESKFTRTTFSKDEDVENLCWDFVDDREGFGRLGRFWSSYLLWLGRGCGLGSGFLDRISNCLTDVDFEPTASSSSVSSAFLAATFFGAAFGFGAAFCRMISKKSQTRQSELTVTLGAALVTFAFFAAGSGSLSSASDCLFVTVAFSGAAALAVFFAGALAFEAVLFTDETFDGALAAGAFFSTGFFAALVSTGVDLDFLVAGAGASSSISEAFLFVALTVVVVLLTVVDPTEAVFLLGAGAAFGAAFVLGAGFAAVVVAFFGGIVIVLARGGWMEWVD